MWLNGPTQYEDHLIGKKHKLNSKPRRRRKDNSSTQCGKGVVIPTGTALIIEQSALWSDAVSRYVLDLYCRASLRARL